MKMIILRFIILMPLFLGVKAHSQIEMFEMSWEKNNKELMEVLVSNQIVTPSLVEIKPFYPSNDRVFCISKDDNSLVGLGLSPSLCASRYESCKNEKCFGERRFSKTYKGDDYLNFQFRKPDILYVNTRRGLIEISCKTFNGCDYTDKEIAQFVLDNIGTSLETDGNGYVSMDYVADKGLCGRGKKGDEVCVKDRTITLIRGSYGTGGMTLSFN